MNSKFSAMQPDISTNLAHSQRKSMNKGGMFAMNEMDLKFSKIDLFSSQ